MMTEEARILKEIEETHQQMHREYVLMRAKEAYLERQYAEAERQVGEERARREAELAAAEAKAKEVLGEELYQAFEGEPRSVMRGPREVFGVLLRYRGKERFFTYQELLPAENVSPAIDWMLEVDEAIREEEKVAKEVREQRKAFVRSLLNMLEEAEAAIERGRLRKTRLPSVWAGIEDYHLHDETELMAAYERVNTKLHQGWDRWIDGFVAQLDRIEVEPTVKGVNEGVRKREKADQELEDLRYAWGFDADDSRLTDAFRRLDERIKAAREERERRRKALQREAAKPFVYYLVYYWAATACEDEEDDEEGPCMRLLSLPALHADPDEGGWWTCITIAEADYGRFAIRKVRLPYAVRVDRVEVLPEAWEAWPSRLPPWLPRKSTPYGEITILWPGMETMETEGAR